MELPQSRNDMYRLSVTYICFHIQGLCKSSEVLQFIRRTIPNARLVEEIGTEMTFILPVEDDYVAQMKKLFGELDKNKAKLFIHTYGLTDTTLEEVRLVFCPSII